VYLLKKLLTYACFLDLAIWLGTAVYFSFLAANRLFANLPEDLAGQAIGVLFPQFFLFTTILSVLGLLLFWMLGRTTGAARKSYRYGLVLLIVGALANLVNLVILLPLIQSVERQMGVISKAAPNLLSRFWMLHGSSMLLEILSIICIAAVWLTISLNVAFQWDDWRK
jgi:uncharacterized membrane protein